MSDCDLGLAHTHAAVYLAAVKATHGFQVLAISDLLRLAPGSFANFQYRRQTRLFEK